MAMGGGIGKMERHPEYYLSDGTVSFLTKERNTLFRVHKSFFDRESQVFRDYFAEAAGDNPPAGTDAHPYVLDITSDEFATFLWVWYDRDYARHEQAKGGWITILRLSDRWGFDRIKELAIRELDQLQLSPAERVSIYDEYRIEGERLVSSYVELCKSPKITAADGQLLQMERLINVLEARENAQRRAHELGHQSPTSASLADEDLRQIVTRVFRTSLTPSSGGTSTGPGAQASDLDLLNGEPAHGTKTRTSTITLKNVQVPDNTRTQSTGEASSRTDKTGSERGGSQEKETQDKNAREKAKQKEALEKQKKEEKEALERKKKEEKEALEKEIAERAKKDKMYQRQANSRTQ